MTSPELIRPIESLQPEAVVEGPIDVREQQVEQGAPNQWVPQQTGDQPVVPIPPASDDPQNAQPVVVPIATETAEAYAAGANITDSKKWFGVAILRVIKRAFASGKRVVVGGN